MFRADRRQFLADLSRASAAVAAATLSGSAELFADEAKRAPAGANDQIHIAIIGARGRGLDHLKGLAGKNNCVVTTLCDCDEAVIGPAMVGIEKAQNRSPKFEKDLRRVMDDPTIHAVSIAMPNHWHSLAGIWAMKQGKDVYVEKPVSHNVWEGRKLVEAAQKYNRICQAGTQIRSMSGVRAAIEFLHEGKLGKVERAYGLCYRKRPSIGRVNGEGPIPATCDYDLWCGPAPKEPLRREKLHYDWHWQWACGNGDLGNQGIHQVDVARWGLNKKGLPSKVLSIGGRYGYVDDGETANTQICWFDYGDCDMIFEVRGLETTDFLADRAGSPTADKRRQARVGIVFYAADGMLVVNSYKSAVAISKSGEVLKVFNTPNGHDLDHYTNFVQAMRSRKPSELRGVIEEGHTSSALCHLGNISYRLGEEVPSDNVRKLSMPEAGECVERMGKHLAANKVDWSMAKVRLGRTLKLDPQSESVAGDAAAAKMLRREYRRGFEVPENV